MREERLKKMIKAMYLLKEVLNKKSDNDIAFKSSPKSKIIGEVDQIIHLGLEEFYALRTDY